MTPRERVLAALDHREPDRVPLDLGGGESTLNIDVYRALLRDLQLSEEILCLDHGIACPSEPVLRRFQIDTRYIYPTLTKINPNPPAEQTDVWHVKRKLIGYYYEITPDGHPLANLRDPEELRDYHWPAPEDVMGSAFMGGTAANRRGKSPVLEDMIRQGEELARRDYAVVFPYGPIGGAFAFAMRLRGFQTFFADLILRPKIAVAIMEKVTEVLVETVQEYIAPLRGYIDVIFFGDDLGTQTGPMISPQTYKKYIKPTHRKIVESLTNATRAKVIIHTDGAVLPFIDDLADIGVSGINPVQVTANGMDTKELKTKFGDKMSFWGGIDTQRVLPFGNEDDVAREVRQRITDLGRGGGYVLTSVHNVQPPTPSQNVIAMFDGAIKYGSAFYSRK